jgi:CHAT domain-containing protein
VLSACDLGTDTGYAGHELVGLVSALFARGTALLLASCVPVSDASIVLLMCALHTRSLLGDPLAVALHGTTATMGQDNPRDWAARYAFSACGAA